MGILIASLICLTVLFIFVVLACAIDGIDFAGFVILLLVGIPLANVIVQLFNL